MSKKVYQSKVFRVLSVLALVAADFKCQICSKKNYGNQVHHIDFDNRNNHPSNLSVLCADCHRFVGKQRFRLEDNAFFADYALRFKALEVYKFLIKS